MITNIGDLQVREDFIVTIAGTVVSVREDEFLLRDSTGQVWVDAIRGGSGTVNLAIGEQVTVVGDLDDPEDFDALQITRADGSLVIGQPFPRGGRPDDNSERDNPVVRNPVGNINSAPFFNIGDLQIREDFFVTLRGTVVSVREDEFLLRDNTGQVWVDAIRGGSGTVNLAIGEQVTVVGDLDDPEDFDALQITRADGSLVIRQPFPRGGRPEGGRGNSRGNGRGNGQGRDRRGGPPNDRWNNELFSSGGNDDGDWNGSRDGLSGRLINAPLVGNWSGDPLTGGRGDRSTPQPIEGILVAANPETASSIFNVVLDSNVDAFNTDLQQLPIGQRLSIPVEFSADPVIFAFRDTNAMVFLVVPGNTLTPSTAVI